MSTPPTRMPDYNPAGRRRFKPLRDRSDGTPRIGQIMGIDPKLLHHALGVVLSSGCAILLSPTGDGGALSITVYHGDDRSRDYVASMEELGDALGVAADLAEAHMMQGAPAQLKLATRPSQST